MLNVGRFVARFLLWNAGYGTGRGNITLSTELECCTMRGVCTAPSLSLLWAQLRLLRLRHLAALDTESTVAISPGVAVQ